MKIGIITVADSANFGSFLQAYALKTILEGMGHEITFIRTRGENQVIKLYYNWKPKIRDFKHPVRFINRNIYGRKKYKMFMEDHAKLNIYDEELDTSPDLVILGSDEIWNVCVETFRKKVFYGEGFKNVIAFAVSSGGSLYEDYLKYPEIIKSIKQIPEIYVRDDPTLFNIKKMTNIAHKVVCDPTFLVNYKKCNSDYRNKYLEQYRYILIYLYPGSISKQAIKAIKKFAREQNLKIISVCFYNYWCNYNIVCRPTDFSSVITKAEYVITGTFHGTVFSIINEKKFISIGLSTKLKDLLKRLELSEWCVEKQSLSCEYLKNKLICQSIDYECINDRVEKMAKASLEHLEEIVDKYN